MGDNDGSKERAADARRRRLATAAARQRRQTAIQPQGQQPLPQPRRHLPARPQEQAPATVAEDAVLASIEGPGGTRDFLAALERFVATNTRKSVADLVDEFRQLNALPRPPLATEFERLLKP